MNPLEPHVPLPQSLSGGQKIPSECKITKKYHHSGELYSLKLPDYRNLHFELNLLFSNCPTWLLDYSFWNLINVQNTKALKIVLY